MSDFEITSILLIFIDFNFQSIFTFSSTVIAIVKFVQLEPLMAQVAEVHFTHGYDQKFSLTTFKHYLVEEYTGCNESVDT